MHRTQLITLYISNISELQMTDVVRRDKYEALHDLTIKHKIGQIKGDIIEFDTVRVRIVDLSCCEFDYLHLRARGPKEACRRLENIIDIILGRNTKIAQFRKLICKMGIKFTEKFDQRHHCDYIHIKYGSVTYQFTFPDIADYMIFHVDEGTSFIGLGIPLRESTAYPVIVEKTMYKIVNYIFCRHTIFSCINRVDGIANITSIADTADLIGAKGDASDITRTASLVGIRDIPGIGYFDVYGSVITIETTRISAYWTVEEEKFGYEFEEVINKIMVFYRVYKEHIAICDLISKYVVRITDRYHLNFKGRQIDIYVNDDEIIVCELINRRTIPIREAVKYVTNMLSLSRTTCL
jgi:hypothetical protein